MKSKILLLSLTVALFTSCTTAYKTGQTPDDVYYSPTRPEDEEYVKNERKEDRNVRSYDEEYYEDQYLRMKIRDRYRWSELDDPYYYSRRYNRSVYNCGCFNNPWTPYTYWNNYYNPYYQNYVIINPKTSTTYNAPRTFNLNTYNNNALTNSNYSNPKYNGSSSSNNNNTYNSPRNNTNTRRDDNSGSILRDIFRGSSNSGSTNSSSSGSSSSGSSSSSSSSNSSSAPVRKF